MNGLAHISTALSLVVGNLEALFSILVSNPLQYTPIAISILTNHGTQPSSLRDVSF
jgi:hypothetical protein